MLEEARGHYWHCNKACARLKRSSIKNLSATIVGSFPGLQLITISLLQGTANVYFTLRVGIMARNYLLTAGENFVHQEARRTANREAVKMRRPLDMSAVALLPAVLKKGWSKLFA
ncbi:MAG: hypothetical protein ACREOO_04145 [bacterium]